MNTYYIIKHKKTDEYYTGTVSCQTEKNNVSPLFDSDINHAVLLSNLQLAKLVCEDILADYNIITEIVKVSRTTTEIKG